MVKYRLLGREDEVVVLAARKLHRRSSVRGHVHLAMTEEKGYDQLILLPPRTCCVIKQTKENEFL